MLTLRLGYLDLLDAAQPVACVLDRPTTRRHQLTTTFHD